FLINLSPHFRFLRFLTVDAGGRLDNALTAGVIDFILIALFAAASFSAAFERATYVNAAKASFLFLIICWQPVTIELCNIQDRFLRDRAQKSQGSRPPGQ